MTSPMITVDWAAPGPWTSHRFRLLRALSRHESAMFHPDGRRKIFDVGQWEIVSLNYVVTSLLPHWKSVLMALFQVISGPINRPFLLGGGQPKGSSVALGEWKLRYFTQQYKWGFQHLWQLWLIDRRFGSRCVTQQWFMSDSRLHTSSYILCTCAKMIFLHKFGLWYIRLWRWIRSRSLPLKITAKPAGHLKTENWASWSAKVWIYVDISNNHTGKVWIYVDISNNHTGNQLSSVWLLWCQKYDRST